MLPCYGTMYAISRGMEAAMPSLAVQEVLARSWVSTGAMSILDRWCSECGPFPADGAHRPTRKEEKGRRRADPGYNPSIGPFLSGCLKGETRSEAAGGNILSSLAFSALPCSSRGASRGVVSLVRL
ncbi:uncharacterized protein PV06_00234 [Exophiala oligosperma]|uniref:Uncharacterized protein n=1 Tax=Exophiala oligosperma TaxID=215243 RepID=A0A0D2CCB5_9EURO|nr:uncharacterized protein PV06_00234 [Exophiala oligosperma]KIW47542.1 hypothetical protein PV06_00234 [Exophiala oligosperma]